LGGVIGVGVFAEELDGVAGANSVGRLAGRVGRFDHCSAAGGDDEVDLTHKLLSEFDRGFFDDLNEVDGGSDFLSASRI